LYFLYGQDRFGQTPSAVALARESYSEVEAFVQSLPPKPELYKHLLGEQAQRDDHFICAVMAKSRELNITWEAVEWRTNSRTWEEQLCLFFDGKRRVEVFREWLKIPYVRAFVVERGAVELSDPDRRWESLAHALADFKQRDLLTALCAEFPEYLSMKVLDNVFNSELHVNRLLLSSSSLLNCEGPLGPNAV
jgi:hypothetical protein